jgi:hypothetical protein
MRTRSCYLCNRLPPPSRAPIKPAARRWHAYGGAGILISKGLGDILADHYDQLSACVREKYAEEHSDLQFTACVFELGYAPTDPGSLMLGGERLFDTFAPSSSGLTVQDLRAMADRYHPERPGNDDRIIRLLSFHLKAKNKRASLVAADIHEGTSILYSLHGSPIFQQVE